MPPECFHRGGFKEGTKMLGCALLSVRVSALAYLLYIVYGLLDNNTNPLVQKNLSLNKIFFNLRATTARRCSAATIQNYCLPVFQYISNFLCFFFATIWLLGCHILTLAALPTWKKSTYR